MVRPISPDAWTRMMAQLAERLTDDERIELSRMAYSAEQVGTARMLWDVLTSEEKIFLGGSLNAALAAHRTAVAMLCAARQCGPLRAVLYLASKFELPRKHRIDYFARRLGEICPDVEDQFESAVGRYSLVIQTLPFCAAWNGEVVAADWENHPKLRNYFLLLCKHSCKGVPLDHTVFGETTTAADVARWKCRLGTLAGFPKRLHSAIQVQRRGGHRLDLPPEDICVLEAHFQSVVSVER